MVCVSQLDPDIYFIFLMAILSSILCFPYSFCNLYLICLVTAWYRQRLYIYGPGGTLILI